MNNLLVSTYRHGDLVEEKIVYGRLFLSKVGECCLKFSVERAFIHQRGDNTHEIFFWGSSWDKMQHIVIPSDYNLIIGGSFYVLSKYEAIIIESVGDL